MSIGIYKITSPSGKIYIGQSINIERRWIKSYKNLQCKSQTRLYNSLKKYGPENHIFEIIEECSINELIDQETKWKLYYNVLEVPSLCCRIDGKGGYVDQKTKDKISEGLKGIKRSQETKDKIYNNISTKKHLYQYNLDGNLVKIWDSINQVNKIFKGNIKNNILGKTKQAGGFIWLREEDLDKLNERVKKIKNHINKPRGKRCKVINLNLEQIKKDYEIIPLNKIANKYMVSIPTLLNYLKENNIYEFRKNYKK